MHICEALGNEAKLPPVINIPGALGTQARHCTDAAALGKLKVVMQQSDSESTRRSP